MKPPGDGVHYDIVANFGELLFNDEPNASKDRHFWFGSSNSESIYFRHITKWTPKKVLFSEIGID